MRDTSGLINALHMLVKTDGSPEAAVLIHAIIRNALNEHDDRIAGLERTIQLLWSEVQALQS